MDKISVCVGWLQQLDLCCVGYQYVGLVVVFVVGVVVGEEVDMYVLGLVCYQDVLIVQCVFWFVVQLFGQCFGCCWQYYDCEVVLIVVVMFGVEVQWVGMCCCLYGECEYVGDVVWCSCCCELYGL